MPYLVDGNNVAGGRHREEVRRTALRLAEREKLQLLLYFDGAPPPGVPATERLGAIEVRYVPHADSAMLSFLRTAGHGWVVVTSDQALAQKAKHLGAQVMPAKAFWEKAASVGMASEKRELSAGDAADFFQGVTPLSPEPDRVRRVKRRRGFRR